VNDLIQLLSQDLFNRVVGATSILAAIASLLTTILGYVLQTWIAHKKLRAAEEEKFRVALESDDLLTLGNYLSSTLGQFTIHEYTTLSQVEHRVNRMFDRLSAFIGESVDVQPVFAYESPSNLNRERVPIPDEFDRVKVDLEGGEIWNGLARLRRMIEIRLRKYAAGYGIKEQHLKSAGQTLRLLADREYISGRSRELLAFAIRVCNEGVHGYPVSLGQAREALSAAAEGLRLLQIRDTESDV